MPAFQRFKDTIELTYLLAVRRAANADWKPKVDYPNCKAYLDTGTYVP